MVKTKKLEQLEAVLFEFNTKALELQSAAGMLQKAKTVLDAF